MKGKIITAPRVLKLLTGNFASAIALYPFILIRKLDFKENKTLINHEKIHLKQQLELLLVFFYLWYFIEYLVRLAFYRNHYKAYKNISFEKEAYCNEQDFNYTKNKTFWSFIKYLK